MPAYRNAKYGAVEASLLDPSVKLIVDQLKIYLNSSQDFEYLKSPKAVGEVIKQFKTLIGNDFRAWLSVNYANGSAVRAPLVRAILGYLNGEISGRMVVDAVTRDRRKLNAFDRTGLDLSNELLSHTPDKQCQAKWLTYLEKVSNHDLYLLIEGIGPDTLANIGVTLNGESADVGR